MKREELKEHGLSEEQINFVMAQNGKDVNALNDKINGLTSERDGLQKQIDDRDEQLTTLKKSAKDNEELQSQIKQLQDENKTAKQNYQDQLAKQNKSFKIEGALRDAKAKNIKTVLPLIDTEKVSVNDDGTLNGLSEQLDNIKQDNGFLFGEENKTPRVEIKNDFRDGNDKSTSDSIVSHIAERFANSNE
ncbi:scaffolding protein [Limosilactobacillus reuteri]|uniref:phage scaffolding protein n=2 Tax=Limosilactobacillus reuteri TaxID=1598 RepID=UPI000D6ECB3D|nr:phage scaffolding protein [Limosilactobacillus reuteri]PWT35203.1 scaffolding protein [Limosilactobacillus reuteri]PWT53593.1 scaffolding protein [Limosilactobacillus reuteri]PWT59821.1 scaffolding protein [Limosilactobacillus reuteri]PWT64521.1 scaffolding protein [Limosilactobacillus reuteri]PWT66517.1 scaffolding protein [Limosilactobacillus reuteri]